MPPKPFPTVTLVASFVSPGVSAGAAGFMIVGGKLVKIGPRGPALAQLAQFTKDFSGGKATGKATAKSSKKTPKRASR